MKNSSLKHDETYKLGIKLIETAIKLDQRLADLLMLEIKKMRKLLNTDISSEQLLYVNVSLQKIIYALTMTEEKIKCGIDLCKIAEDSYSNLNKDDFC